MNVLVTGGAGFIGTHLTKRILSKGHTVTILDNMRRARADAVRELSDTDGVRMIEGDIRDTSAVRTAPVGAEVVYHLAAQSNVMGAITDVEYSVSTNVVGTVNVLSASREAGARRVVFASSREAYGEARYVPVDETHPTTPKNLYGASKVAGEAYCRAFATNDFDASILRFANVYGPGDRDRVIPLFVDHAVRGEPLVVYGGQQMLDFVWIETVVDAFEVAGASTLGEEVNVGTSVGTTILDLARRVIREAGSSSEVDLREARAVEVTRFVADTTRMRAHHIEPDVDPLAHLGELIGIARRENAPRGR